MEGVAMIYGGMTADEYRTIVLKALKKKFTKNKEDVFWKSKQHAVILDEKKIHGSNREDSEGKKVFEMAPMEAHKNFLVFIAADGQTRAYKYWEVYMMLGLGAWA